MYVYLLLPFHTLNFPLTSFSLTLYSPSFLSFTHVYTSFNTNNITQCTVQHVIADATHTIHEQREELRGIR